jgi:hypothetical protein
MLHQVLLPFSLRTTDILIVVATLFPTSVGRAEQACIRPQLATFRAEAVPTLRELKSTK